jgi:hypothetical protein
MTSKPVPTWISNPTSPWSRPSSPAASDRPREERPATTPDPVFVLAGGGRTGSTLLQRLLLSTREVLVWGEHEGAFVEHLAAIEARVAARNRVEGAGALGRFLANGHNDWVANMLPDATGFRSGARAYFEASLGEQARQLGFPRWGVKEIRYGLEAGLFLHALYPNARFIVLIRHPAACLRSIKGTSWYGKDYGADPRAFTSTWARLTRELVELKSRVAQAALVKYEELTAADTSAVVARIAAVSGVAVERFDVATFRHRVRGTPTQPAPLDQADRDALARPEVARVAEAVGYGVEG